LFGTRKLAPCNKFGVEATRVSINEFFGFAITSPGAAEEAGISDPAMEFTADNPFRFSDQVSRGTQAVYAQDDFSPLPSLKISAGLRYDHSALLVSDQQLSPRIGASYDVPFTHTTLRASFNRLYMPPQVENLLIASSEQARELSPFAASGGGADIRPEKLSAWEAGFSQELPKNLRLNMAYWWRRFRNIGDPNVLLGTTIIFPNSVARAKAQGLDVRLDVPMRRGLSGYFSYTNNRIVEIGPINGGLFLEDEFIEIGPGTRFSPDHDQRNVASFAITYAARRRDLWTSFSGRYESGVPLELPDLDSAELQALPGSNLVNFDTGRVKAWYVFSWSGGMDLLREEHFTVGAQLDVQNIANRAFAFNWGNPFSGTHFGYPRLVVGSLKFSFKK
jgi:outer membrane receptor protein involved in Fe transport